ncbi:MAG: pyridoxal phosphate-dependent aminotransferase [Flavobacteriaceae bacterium]|jgi:cystathionine beta-lyase|nr:pyridoxal phosphate-dependent aminotransferase [Flavobacteriaceae bacterium]
MTKYNFDQIIERKGTDSFKYGVLKRLYGRDDLIPLWVADMDFSAPPVVIEALTKRAQHGIYGYTFASDDYYNTIIGWQARRNGWAVSKEEICFVPGVVKGISFAIDLFSCEGDKIIIQPPVYHPFRIVLNLHKREVISNPLIFDGVQYRMDFANLEQLAEKENTKILILSNPHNPGGRVWTKEELAQLADICFKHKILVISDEIHSDLVFNGNKHVPFAMVSKKAAQNSILLGAPSKTFNIAGIVSSYSIIKNPKIREKYYNYLKKSELDDGTIFAYLALQAAYNHGEDWLAELKTYLWKNILFVDDYLKKNIPKIKVVMPEASFLLWLDCRELHLHQKDLNDLFTNKARLALNDGSMFGIEGTGFMRMNIGCPISVLGKAMKQLKEAVELREN